MATIVAIATIATFPHRFGVRSQQTDAKSRRCKSKLTTNNTANDADWRRSRRDENVTGAIGVIGRVALELVEGLHPALLGAANAMGE